MQPILPVTVKLILDTLQGLETSKSGQKADIVYPGNPNSGSQCLHLDLK